MAALTQHGEPIMGMVVDEQKSKIEENVVGERENPELMAPVTTPFDIYRWSESLNFYF